MSKNISKKNFKNLTRGVTNLELDFLEVQDTQTLGNLAIQPIPGVGNFSFNQLDLDQDFIQNPNIIENKVGLNLKNNISDAENKFSEAEDPIYDFDDPPDISVRKPRRNFNNSKDITRRIKKANKNLNNNIKRYN